MCDDDNETLGKPSGNTNTVYQHGLFATLRRSVGKKKANLILLAKNASSSSSSISASTSSEGGGFFTKYFVVKLCTKLDHLCHKLFIYR
jgi:hypothetical protein